MYEFDGEINQKLHQLVHTTKENTLKFKKVCINSV